MGDGMNDRRPVVPEGFDRADTQLVLREDVESLSKRAARVRLALGVTWCVLGSAFVPMAPVASNVLLAFGMASVMSGTGLRERVACLLLSLAVSCGLGYVLAGAGSLPLTVLSVACAFGLSWVLVEGRLRTWQVVVASVFGTGATLTADVISASLAGTSVTELVTKVVNDAVEANLESLDLSGTTALLETRDSLLALWPTLYFAVVLGLVACTLVGAWLGARTSGVAVEPGLMARFDLPLWVALCLGVGIVVELAGSLLPAWQEEVQGVAANVVACSRILLAAQGLSVLIWMLRARGVPPLVRLSVVMLGFWLELSFALTSVVGLADMALNFRHLERRRPSLSVGPSRER